ncbi:MAG: proliferating cell nuclear antigen (pcna) [Candidatus Micrarchaeota archaeon]
MVEIEIEDARFWKSCVDAIVNLIEEGTFEINSDGINLRAMDPSQIAMVIFSVPKSAFVKYEVSSPAKVSVNLNNLAKILSRVRNKEKLVMSLEENKLALQFTSPKGKRSFNIPLIDMPPGHQKEPKIEHDASVVIEGGAFKEILRDAALISSHLTLKASSDGFEVDAHGDSADLKVESEKTGEGVKEIKATKEAKATFPLQYLEDISKSCSDSDTLTASIKTNAPIKITYKVGEASLTYYLAPRIDSD